MSEQRKKQITLLMKLEKRPNIKVELFPAEEWGKGARVIEGQSQSLYRLRIKNVWFSREKGPQPDFLTLAEAMSVAEALLSKALGKSKTLPMPVSSPLAYPPGVKVRLAEEDGGFLRTWTRTIPFQAQDGEWMVWVVGYRYPVKWSDLKLVEQPSTGKAEQSSRVRAEEEGNATSRK